MIIIYSIRRDKRQIKYNEENIFIKILIRAIMIRLFRLILILIRITNEQKYNGVWYAKPAHNSNYNET